MKRKTKPPKPPKAPKRLCRWFRHDWGPWIHQKLHWRYCDRCDAVQTFEEITQGNRVFYAVKLRQ